MATNQPAGIGERVQHRCPICNRLTCHVYLCWCTLKWPEWDQRDFFNTFHPLRCRNPDCKAWAADERGFCWVCEKVTRPLQQQVPAPAEAVAVAEPEPVPAADPVPKSRSRKRH